MAASLFPPLQSFSILAILLVKNSISESISSVSIISMSRAGSGLPFTCTIFSFSKQRTTCKIASHSRICERNLLPNPSPLLAPATKPAISTNSTIAGVHFSALYNLTNGSKRSSGTLTIPIFGSIVQNG